MKNPNQKTLISVDSIEDNMNVFWNADLIPDPYMAGHILGAIAKAMIASTQSAGHTLHEQEQYLAAIRDSFLETIKSEDLSFTIIRTPHD